MRSCTSLGARCSAEFMLINSYTFRHPPSPHDSCYILRSTPPSNIRHARQSWQQQHLDKPVTPGISLSECHLLSTFSNYWPVSGHEPSSLSFLITAVSESTLLQQLLSLSASITSNIACYQCHMVRCKRPPRAAFEMSVAASFVKHICLSLSISYI